MLCSRDEKLSEMNCAPPTILAAAKSNEPLDWTVISAVNNDAVLRSCLLSSPDVSAASEVILQSGYQSAATAFNAAIEKAKSDVLVFVHQDVFLPKGWLDQLQCALKELEAKDPKWAVAGVWGGKQAGEFTGHLYCAGLAKVLGQPNKGPVEVNSLDEVLLILRKSSGVRFDERLEGYHMYGTDICLEAKTRGLKSYAISAFCVHNTNGYRMLPWAFWRSYFFMRRKWKHQLPITTSCTKITFGCWPMLAWNADRFVNLLLRRHYPGRRVPDPKLLYDELVRSGSVASANFV